MKLNWTSVRVLDLDLLTTWSNLNFVSKAGGWRTDGITGPVSAGASSNGSAGLATDITAVTRPV